MRLVEAVAEPRGVFAALTRAVPVFFSARLFALVLVPLVGAALLWSVVAWFGWAPLAQWLGARLFDATSGLSAFTSGVIATLALILAAALTALVAIAVFAMPVIVDLVAARHFATLERRNGGTFIGSAANALTAIALFLPLWILSLFTLFLPPLYVAISLALNAWLNQRMFRYDALATHADRNELSQVIRASRRKLFLLGLVLAPLSLVPLVNFVAPLYAGVAFTHLCLDELAVIRARRGQLA